MSFEHPAALWALATLVLLAIFSLWRQAAVRTTVPSLLLWKKIPERNPPIRALRRPKWRLELLLQALAIAAIAAALASPFAATSRRKPRRVAFVFDTSARMASGGRLEKAKAEARRLKSEKLSEDQVVVYAATPAPRRFGSLEEAESLQPVHAHVDVATLLAAARQEAEHVVLFSDRDPLGSRSGATLPGRPPEAVHARLLGGEPGNLGVVEFAATDGEVFARIANHGPAREVPIVLDIDGRRVAERATVPSGVSPWFRRGDFSKAESVTVEIDVADPFPLDNRARATRLGSPRTTVSVTGRHTALLLRALESIPGVTLRDVRGTADVAVGVDEAPGRGTVSVRIHSPVNRLTGEVEVIRHPLTAGLETRGQEMGSGGTGELPPEFRPGESLFRVGGRIVGAIRGRDVHLCFDTDPHRGWPATFSFPILWTNVIDFSRRGAATFAVARTGRPFELPAEAAVVEPSGRETPPSRTLLGYAVGEYRVKLPEGERALWANLLDERESDTAGVSRALDWDPADPAGREPVRRPLAAVAAALALLLIGLAWLLQRRGD